MDLPRLRGKIAENNVGQKELAILLKCSRQAVFNKVNGKSPIKVDEAQRLSELLNLTDQEKLDIFLS